MDIDDHETDYIPQLGAAAAARAEAIAKLQQRLSGARQNPFDGDDLSGTSPTTPSGISRSNSVSSNTVEAPTASAPPAPAPAPPAIVSSTMNCPNCGAVIMATAARCGACQTVFGAARGDGDAAPHEDAPAHTDARADMGGDLPELQVKAKPQKKGWRDFLARHTGPTRHVDENEDARMRLQLQAASDNADRNTTRVNLFNLCKLAVKTLIESAIGFSEKLGDDHPPLAQLCVVLEHCMRHGMKERKGPFLTLRNTWGYIESMERMSPRIGESVRAARSIPGIKTPAGRARAWLRVSLMEKALAEVLKDCLAQEAVLVDWYEPWAFFRSEDAMVLCGLLVGLNFIDVELSLQGAVLDTAISSIDYSLYLKDGNYLKAAEPRPDREHERFGEEQFMALSDQKVYQEELNRTLKLQLADITAQATEAAAEKEVIMRQLRDTEAALAAEQAAHAAAVAAAQKSKEELERKLSLQAADVEAERATYQQSRSGLDQIYHALDKQLQTERQAREAAEADVARLIGVKHALEENVAKLNADVQDKLDTIEGLRKQLKDVKTLNLQTQSNAQELETKFTARDADATRLEQAHAALTNEVAVLQTQAREAAARRALLEKTLLDVTSKLTDIDARRGELETNIAAERLERGVLQKELAESKQRAGQLGERLESTQIALAASQKDAARLRADVAQLQKHSSDQEKTLVELGNSLSTVAMKMHVIEDKERAQQRVEAQQWADASTVVSCKACQKDFTISRRKHHCRRCGQVFCNECSDNQMPIPPASKPVRVCDSCETELLKAMTRT